jgi:peptidoglycan/xylan/chitin deacetylase (PgdA/CDA1 family)
MLKQIFSWLSPAGPKGRISILIFHRVIADPDPIFPDQMDAKRFNEICGWVADLSNVLPLDEAIARLVAGTLPARAVSITFDDGYADTYQIAIPILKRHGLNATFFVSTGFVDGGCLWNDAVVESIRRTDRSCLELNGLIPEQKTLLAVSSIQDKRDSINYIIKELKYKSKKERAALVDHVASSANVKLPTDLMLTSCEIRSMRREGMLVGAHTVTHPILAGLGPDDVRSEVQQSKSTLESLLGERIGLFAYPNGKPHVDYSDETVAIVRSIGFDAALSTRWAAAGSGTDLFQIPRFTPWDRGQKRFASRLITNLLVGTP